MTPEQLLLNFPRTPPHLTGEMAGYKYVNLVWTYRDFCLQRPPRQGY